MVGEFHGVGHAHIFAEGDGQRPIEYVACGGGVYGGHPRGGDERRFAAFV